MLTLYVRQVLDESGGVVPHRGRLCGSSLPPPLVATGNLKLKFVTDGSASSRGFHATYETNRRGATGESPQFLLHLPRLVYRAPFFLNFLCIFCSKICSDS